MLPFVNPLSALHADGGSFGAETYQQSSPGSFASVGRFLLILWLTCIVCMIVRWSTTGQYMHVAIDLDP